MYQIRYINRKHRQRHRGKHYTHPLHVSLPFRRWVREGTYRVSRRSGRALYGLLYQVRGVPGPMGVVARLGRTLARCGELMGFVGRRSFLGAES